MGKAVQALTVGCENKYPGKNPTPTQRLSVNPIGRLWRENAVGAGRVFCDDPRARPARAPFPLSLLQLQACTRGIHCASCTPLRLTVMTVSIL